MKATGRAAQRQRDLRPQTLTLDRKMSNWLLCRRVRAADRPFASVRRRRKTRSTILLERDCNGGYFIGFTGLPDFTCRLQFVFKALQEEKKRNWTTFALALVFVLYATFCGSSCLISKEVERFWLRVEGRSPLGCTSPHLRSDTVDSIR